MRHAGRSAIIAGGLVLLLVGVAPAQVGGNRGGGGSGSSSSGGSFLGSSGGSSGGSFTGSSGGGGTFTGSSGGGGSFTGSSGGSFGGSTGSGGNASGSSANVGSTTQFGRYYDNPLYNGLATNQSSSSSAGGSKYLRAAPVATSFGNPLYNAASLTTTTTTRGATGIGTQGTGTTFSGATSAGIRRAPGYITEPVFDSPPRPTLEAMRPELQSVVSRASRLPSRESIRVLTDGDTVVLRGQVRDERERRLAEAMIRLSPGVRLVRNELEPLSKPPGK